MNYQSYIARISIAAPLFIEFSSLFSSSRSIQIFNRPIGSLLKQGSYGQGESGKSVFLRKVRRSQKMPGNLLKLEESQ